MVYIVMVVFFSDKHKKKPFIGHKVGRIQK